MGKVLRAMEYYAVTVEFVSQGETRRRTFHAWARNRKQAIGLIGDKIGQDYPGARDARVLNVCVEED